LEGVGANMPKPARVAVQRPPANVNDVPATRSTARAGPQNLKNPPEDAIPSFISAAEHFGAVGAAASAGHALRARASRLAVTIAVRIRWREYRLCSRPGQQCGAHEMGSC